ncbi:MAG: LysM peptidoglycan-binding domain-containing protein [Actinobacteria bacterium]|nr:MAG: LysM peptidoglycan-binding domain-containing protein [Actinomycetota bacterium]
MRSHTKSCVDISLLRLFGLISMEIGLLDALYRLESLPFLRTPGADPPAWRLWLASTPPQDAVAAVLRLAATAAAWWLLATTGLYLAARLTRVPAMVRALEWTTPRAVRRLIDRAVALSVIASLAGGTAAFAGGGNPPAAVVAAVGRQPGILLPRGTTPGTQPQPSPEPLPVPIPPVASIPPAAQVPPVAPVPESSALREGAAPPGLPDRYTVQRGDNLWTIAANHLADSGVTRSNGRIAPYWKELIQENRGGLRSGNPDLIFPGETVTLPPIS